MLNSVSFTLEVFPRKKNLILININSVLSYLKTVFIVAKVTSAEITDHFGNKHNYCDGEFLDSDQFDGSPQTTAWLNGHPGLPSIHVWKGLVNIKTNQVGDLISKISTFSTRLYDTYGYFWKFDEKHFQHQRIIDLKSSKSMLSPKPINFALGNIVNADRFVSHFSTQELSEISDINVNLVPNKNELILMFTLLDKTATEKKVKFCYDCNAIKSVVIHHVEPIGFSLYANLSYAPKMFVSEADNEKLKWKRKNSCNPITRDLLGKCNVLRLSWLVNNMSYISDLYFWRSHLRFDLSFGDIRNENSLITKSTELQFPDEIMYALACIKSLSYNYQDDLQINHQGEIIMNKFIKKQIEEGKCDQVLRALHNLYYSYENGIIIDVFSHFKYHLIKVELEWESIKDLEQDTEQLKYIKTAILTPTRTVFTPPATTRTSIFLDLAETAYCLRTVYRDENGRALSPAIFNNFNSNPLKKAEDEDEDIDCVTSMLQRIPKNGLCVAGRSYEYYGASTSQLKDGGMMLYAKDSQSRTAASIRDSLGDVKEKNVSKYIARIGLSLSQVMAFVDLPECTKLFLASDVYGSNADKLYNFTDGCGCLSLKMARYIYDELIRQKVLEPKGDDNYVPSAFQIRFMGSKGMLVVDSDLPDMTIVIRESMQKMFAKKDKLGIVKVSEPRRAYLNKPFIMVLNQIGSENYFFAMLTNATIRALNSSFYDEKVALMTMKLYSFINRLINIGAFAECGFDFLNDSFFQSILRLSVKQAFDSLKSKQRIPLPWFEARTMFGVCDTTAKYPKEQADSLFQEGICKSPNFGVYTEGLGTGVLKAGQVFYWPSDYTQPCLGECIVTKFPTSDLGGVRRLVAVDCKELHHIRDCIVFPVDGNRPHQDEMAGSDLDGDEYCVIWMEDFLKIQQRTAMIYPEIPKGETKDGISEELMIKHHIDCVRADEVGQISNAQLAFADSMGFDSSECSKLSFKYNVALDAPKHGFSSDHSLRYGDRPLEAPDFMNKWSTTPTYYSSSASGEIYRMVNFHLLSSDLLHAAVEFKADSNIDERLLHPEMLKYITFAAELLSVYEAVIRHLLTKYGLRSEIELLTGILNESSPSLVSESNHFKDKEDAMVSTINSVLINKMNEIFDSKMINASEDDKMAAASAIYYISKQKVQESTTSYIGLPFIGKCGFYLRKYMKSNEFTTKKQEKALPKKGIAGPNQLATPNLSMVHIIPKIKIKLKAITQRFLSYGKMPRHKALEVAQKIDEVMSPGDSCTILSSPNELISELIQATLLIWTNLAGIKSNELNLDQFICSTIPHLILSLLLDETSSKSEIVNESFLVRQCDLRILNSLWKLLDQTLATGTQIEILSNSKEKNSIPVVIYGSPTSIWAASMIIGIHNRLRSIYFKKLCNPKVC